MQTYWRYCLPKIIGRVTKKRFLGLSIICACGLAIRRTQNSTNAPLRSREIWRHRRDTSRCAAISSVLGGCPLLARKRRGILQLEWQVGVSVQPIVWDDRRFVHVVFNHLDLTVAAVGTHCWEETRQFEAVDVFVRLWYGIAISHSYQIWFLIANANLQVGLPFACKNDRRRLISFSRLSNLFFPRLVYFTSLQLSLTWPSTIRTPTYWGNFCRWLKTMVWDLYALQTYVSPWRVFWHHHLKVLMISIILLVEV